VPLAPAYDIDRIAEKAQLLPVDWQKRLPIVPGSLLIAMDSAAATVLSPQFD
jgi:ABC-type sulfate transport system substrate-binding protein